MRHGARVADLTVMQAAARRGGRSLSRRCLVAADGVACGCEPLGPAAWRRATAGACEARFAAAAPLSLSLSSSALAPRPRGRQYAAGRAPDARPLRRTFKIAPATLRNAVVRRGAAYAQGRPWRARSAPPHAFCFFWVWNTETPRLKAACAWRADPERRRGTQQQHNRAAEEEGNKRRSTNRSSRSTRSTRSKRSREVGGSNCLQARGTRR